MSAYISREELSDLGISSGSWSSIATGTVDAIITGSSGMVDSYLRSSETLPLASIPVEIKLCTAAISAYQLMGVIGVTDDAQMNLIRLRYEDQIGSTSQKGWLQKVASGEVSLSSKVDATPDENEAAPKYTSGYTEDPNAQGWSIYSD